MNTTKYYDGLFSNYEFDMHIFSDLTFMHSKEDVHQIQEIADIIQNHPS
jgi:hypothetical protein